jgi:hypothetical protein
MILGVQKYDPLYGRRRVSEKACKGADPKKEPGWVRKEGVAITSPI